MKKGERFYRFVNGIIRILAVAIIAAMGLQSIFSTSFIGKSINQNGRVRASTLNILDNPWKHFLVFVLSLLMVSYLVFLFRKKGINRFVQTNSAKIIKIFCVFVFVAGVLWIVITQLAPSSDQAKVYKIAMQWRRGNFMAYAEGGYLFRYPFQTGIVLFYYLLSFVFGLDNYVGAQLVNVIALVLIYYFLAKLAQFFWRNDTTIAVAVYAGVAFWIPFFFYVTYQYGVLPGMACSMGAVYAMTQYLTFRKYRYIIIAALCMGVATVLKMNCLIYAVAIACFLIYDAIELLFFAEKESGKKWMASFLFIVALFVGVWGCNRIVNRYAENLSGYEMPEGEAMLSWIVMGLSDAELGPGFYTGYINRVFVENHYDTELINQASIAKIKELLKEMVDDPLKTGIPFFAEKTAFQWNDPTFIGMDRTKERDAAFIVPDYAQSIIDGQGSVVLYILLNYVQTMVWLGALLYLVRSRKSNNIYELIGVVIFLGGFFFHLAWESSGSYTIPYFLVMIPYAIKGFVDCGRSIVKTVDIARENGFTISEEYKKKIVTWVAVSIAGVFVLLLFSGTGLFTRTLALNDGTDAENQFYHKIKEEEMLKNSYYYISPVEDVGKILAEDHNRIGVVAMENDREKADCQNRILIQMDEGGTKLRFRNTERVLGVETTDGKNLLISYMDDDLNLFYEKSDTIKTVWNIRKIDDSSYYILYGNLALTYESGEIALEELQEKASQRWIVQ